MRIILILSLGYFLTACAVQTPQGKTCTGEVPYTRTASGDAITTHTGGCLDDILPR